MEDLIDEAIEYGSVVDVVEDDDVVNPLPSKFDKNVKMTKMTKRAKKSAGFCGDLLFAINEIDEEGQMGLKFIILYNFDPICKLAIYSYRKEYCEKCLLELGMATGTGMPGITTSIPIPETLSTSPYPPPYPVGNENPAPSPSPLGNGDPRRLLGFRLRQELWSCGDNLWSIDEQSGSGKNKGQWQMVDEGYGSEARATTDYGNNNLGVALPGLHRLTFMRHEQYLENPQIKSKKLDTMELLKQTSYFMSICILCIVHIEANLLQRMKTCWCRKLPRMKTLYNQREKILWIRSSGKLLSLSSIAFFLANLLCILFGSKIPAMQIRQKFINGPCGFLKNQVQSWKKKKSMDHPGGS
ncbi:hypothetical protein LXL04_028246 [Taraxacum kok-saghyz]